AHLLHHAGAPRRPPAPPQPAAARGGVRRVLCADGPQVRMSDGLPPLDLDWVSPQLAVGGRFPREAAARLARGLGITRVVDVRGECCDDEEELRRQGVTLLNLPTQDRCAVAQEMLDTGVRWVL